MNTVTLTGTGHSHGQEFIKPGMKIRLIVDTGRAFVPRRKLTMDENREGNLSETEGQIANMSKLDFLLLLWEARIVGQDCVEANS